MKHDFFWTTSATFTATFLEWGICHFMATGALSFNRNMSDSLYKHIFWALFLCHIREPHFYVMHRTMHPWRNPYLPDVGKFLYRNVHALHHRSYNTTALSGTSMHPVESTLYYTAGLMAIPFGCHPIIPVAIMFDAGIGAWLGHGGFVFPGTGDMYHTIHHLVFDANYGTPTWPFDYAFGTFAATPEDVKGLWQRNQAVGKENSGTNVHNASTHNKKVL